jgi:orotate phosphoribosyltransferase
MALADELRKLGVTEKVHTLLASGRHTMEYVFKERIFLNPLLLKRIVGDFYEILYEINFDLITGPAQAGAIIASYLDFVLDKPFVFPEKAGDSMRFRKIFADFIPKKRVAILEDNITTGDSTDRVIRAVSELDGIVVAVVALWSREDYKPRLWKDGNWSNKEIPFFPLIKEKIPSYDPSGKENPCPGCIAGLDLIDPKTGLILKSGGIT